MAQVNYMKIPKDCPVGRDELLSWINSIVGVGYRKIEDCSNGAAFCQVIDALHPDSIQLGKVKFDATSENDIVNNYKILQEGLYANEINKNLNISQFLTKKVNSTLEMLQWLYQYSHLLLETISYDPFERRKHFKCKEPKLTKITAYYEPDYQEPNDKPEEYQYPPQKAQNQKKQPNYPHLSPPKQRNANLSSSSSLSASSSTPESDRKIRHLERKVKKLEYELDATTKERDFYWKRLRQIELYCTNNDSTPAQEILEMLYQTDSENGFVTPE